MTISPSFSLSKPILTSNMLFHQPQPRQQESILVDCCTRPVARRGQGMSRHQYLFINKTADSDSLSHSNKPERVRIHSHVQKGNRRQSTVDEGSQTSSEAHQLTAPTGKAAWTQWISRFSANSEQHGDRRAPPLASTYNQQTDESRSNHLGLMPMLDPTRIRRLPTRPQAIPRFPQREHTVVDPFDVTCIKVDATVHQLLQYFLTVSHPNTWHTEQVPRKNLRYTFRSDAMTIIQGCLHDEMNMYCLLASMASQMTFLDCVNLQQDERYFIHNAIVATQKHFQGHPVITTRLVFNVFHLGVAEWYRFNVDAAYVHLKAAKAMIDQLGGLKQIDKPLVEMIILGDGYVAAERLTAPVFSADDFDPGGDEIVIQQGLRSIKTILSGRSHIAAGLLASSQQDVVQANMRWIIMDLAVCLSLLKDHLAGRRDIASSPNTLHWLHLRNLAIRHRLLAMDVQDARADALRIALVMWTLMAFTVTGLKRSVKTMVSKLRQVLLPIPDERWEGHKEVRLWILVIGAISATEASWDQSWFWEEITELPVADLRDAALTESALIHLCDQFFYLESVQKSMLQNLSQNLSAFRASPTLSNHPAPDRCESEDQQTTNALNR